MDKARQIRKNQLREDRAEELKKLDVEFMRAMEMGNAEKISQITAKKQRLRDFPSSEIFSQAQTSDDLKEITLDTFLNV